MKAFNWLNNFNNLMMHPPAGGESRGIANFDSTLDAVRRIRYNRWSWALVAPFSCESENLDALAASVVAR